MYNDLASFGTETPPMERFDIHARSSIKDERKRVFAQNLHRARMQKGWSQSELARRSDIPRDMISNYANGKHLPTIDNLTKLAQALGVSETMLVPDFDVSIVSENEPIMSLNPIPGRGNVYRLLIDAPVTLDLGVRIMGMLRGEAANR
jgi:transcriptional regulator with XRE-family HTH domain